MTGDELSVSIDDHLGSVDAAVRNDGGVVFVAAGEIGRRERVTPTEMIPIIDVLFESDDLDAVEGLLLAELLEEGIGGRTTGAAFGGEEFDDDGLFFGVSAGGGDGSPVDADGHDCGNGGEQGESEDGFGAHGD